MSFKRLTTQKITPIGINNRPLLRLVLVLLASLLVGHMGLVLPLNSQPQVTAQSSQSRDQEGEPPSATAELLKQLTELREEVKALRNEVRQLRRTVAEIYRVAVRRSLPAPKIAKVSLDGDPVLGNPEAKVVVVEFSDYQCPFCRRFHIETFPQIKKTYIDTGKIKYIFRDFPLATKHSQARGAAIAANCAGKQDVYWEMHDRLFANQHRLGSELYEELARGLQLDVSAFLTCLEDPDQGKEVDEDVSDGQSIAVRGTPHFFVGRAEGGRLVDVRRLTGAQPFHVFAQLIDSFLK